MAVPTRDELVAQADAAYPDFMATATKAQIQALLDTMAGREVVAAPVEYITFRDRYGVGTIIDLKNGTLQSRPMQRTFEGGVLVEGTGTTLEIDLSTLWLYADDVIEFDPPPSESAPIKFTFSGITPQEAWQPQPDPVPEEVPA